MSRAFRTWLSAQLEMELAADGSGLLLTKVAGPWVVGRNRAHPPWDRGGLLKWTCQWLQERVCVESYPL